MHDSGLKILGEKWTDITNKVLKPLWYSEFQKLYLSAKMDEDDFFSMAGVELTKAFKKYDETVSDVSTYAATVVRNKARTEIRDWTRRDNRKAGTFAESLNQKINDNTEEWINTIQDDFTEQDVGCAENVYNYLNLLPKKQIIFLLCRVLGFSEEEICRCMGGQIEAINKMKQSMKNTVQSDKLKIRGNRTCTNKK